MKEIVMLKTAPGSDRDANGVAMPVKTYEKGNRYQVSDDLAKIFIGAGIAKLAPAAPEAPKEENALEQLAQGPTAEPPKAAEPPGEQSAEEPAKVEEQAELNAEEKAKPQEGEAEPSKNEKVWFKKQKKNKGAAPENK